MNANRIRTFEDLVVWQQAISFVKELYQATDEGALRRDFGLKDQMRRAAVSIPTNIAEGFERRSRNEYLFFLNVAKGSSGESRSLLRVARDLGYLAPSSYDSLLEAVLSISKSLYRQMESIRRAPQL